MIFGELAKNEPVQFVKQEEIKKNLHFYGDYPQSCLI